MRKELLQKKVHTDWTWVLMIVFFILGVVNIYFGLLGFVCMLKPVYHALKGRGRVHCSHYCPRGAIFGKFLPKISLGNALPVWMRSKFFKNSLILIMAAVFGFALIHSGGDPRKISFAVFRLMIVSSIFGLVLGIFFKPRSWCQVCPMGTGTGYIRDALRERSK